MTVVDKSSLLTLLLSIEIFFFSKRNNEALQNESNFDTIPSFNKKQREDQLEKWLKNNDQFGILID